MNFYLITIPGVREKSIHLVFLCCLIYALFYYTTDLFDTSFRPSWRCKEKYICNVAKKYGFFKKSHEIFGMPNVPSLIVWHCKSIELANIFHRKNRNKKSDHALQSYSILKEATSPSSAAISDFFHNTNHTEKNDQISKYVHWPNKAQNVAFES